MSESILVREVGLKTSLLLWVWCVAVNFLTLSFSSLFLYFFFDFFDFLIFPDAIVLTINFAEEGMGVAFLKTKPISYPNQISVL